MKKYLAKIFPAISLIAWWVFSLADSNHAGFFSSADNASLLVPLSITLMAWLAVVLSPLLALALPMMFAQFMLGGREYGFTITKNLLLESFALTFFYSILFYFYLAWLPESHGCSCVGLLALMGVLFMSLFGVLASLGEATAGDEFDESSSGLARFRARHAKLFAFCTKFFVCASVFLQAAFAVGAAVFFYGLKISHELNEMKWLAFFLPLAHVFFTSCLIVLAISRNIFDFSKALGAAAFVFAAVFLSISSVSPLSAQMAMKKNRLRRGRNRALGAGRQGLPALVQVAGRGAGGGAGPDLPCRIREKRGKEGKKQPPKAAQPKTFLNSQKHKLNRPACSGRRGGFFRGLPFAFLGGRFFARREFHVPSFSPAPCSDLECAGSGGLLRRAAGAGR